MLKREQHLLGMILCCLLLLLAACGTSNNGGDFSLGTQPATLSVTAGSTATLSVTANAISGFSKTVAVSLGTLPSGITASPMSLTLTPGTAQTMTLTAAAGLPSRTGTLTLTGTSGTLTHTATVALAIGAAPVAAADFALTVNPASQNVTIGGAGASFALLATPLNGFTGTVSVATAGLPSGVTISPTALSLTPGSSLAATLTASSTAAAGMSTVTFTGTAGALSHTATLRLTVHAATTLPTTAAAAAPDITTYHYDNTREGLNAQEITLTPANVNAATFGLLGAYTLDGRVDAQPLVMNGLTLAGGSVANVVYVATENDSVYALNAANGSQVWKTTVLGANETPSDTHSCNQIIPTIGITSTPVIDPKYGAHGAIFVVGMTKDAGGSYHQRLHALDLTTGAELANSPTEITATYPGGGENSTNGQLAFNPGQYAERAALLLAGGTIYTAWTSHCDIAPYNGWVMAYSESTLRQTSVINLTPNGSEGSIWMAGFGMAADASNNLYFLDANGTLDTSFTATGLPAHADYGNAMLKLSTGNGLAVSDYFEPFNSDAESENDVDLGSGGAMLLPDETDANGALHQLVLGTGKDGNIYVADRNNMGKFNAGGTNNNLYQELDGALPNGAWSGPAYWNNTVYYAGVNDVLRAFPIASARLASAPSSTSAAVFAYPGTTPSVSSNGTQNAIVWAVESATNVPAVLHAYDATNLAHELYNSTEAANGRDSFGVGNKFITPAVTNGMVFLGTPTGIAIFGLLTAPH